MVLNCQRLGLLPRRRLAAAYYGGIAVCCGLTAVLQTAHFPIQLIVVLLVAAAIGTELAAWRRARATFGGRAAVRARRRAARRVVVARLAHAEHSAVAVAAAITVARTLRRARQGNYGAAPVILRACRRRRDRDHLQAHIARRLGPPAAARPDAAAAAVAGV